MINYDFPMLVKDYVHRIGRTGRCKNLGTSYTFLTYDNARLAKELVEVLKESNQQVSEELIELAGSRGTARSSSSGNYGSQYGGMRSYNRNTGNYEIHLFSEKLGNFSILKILG